MDRILLVQDGGPAPGVLTALARHGYRTLVAGGAHSGIAIAQRIELRAVISTYKLGSRSGVWLFNQIKAFQPGTMRILCGDDPRIDLDKVVASRICHATIGYPIVPAILLDLLAGVPEEAPVDRTPIISVPY